MIGDSVDQCDSTFNLLANTPRARRSSELITHHKLESKFTNSTVTQRTANNSADNETGKETHGRQELETATLKQEYQHY